MAGSKYLLRHEEYLRLTRNQSYVRENMDSDFMLRTVDMLYQEQNLDFKVYQDFNEIRLTRKQAEELFHILVTGTSHRYRAFCDFCKEEHPEMYERLYITDYDADPGLLTDSTAANEDVKGPTTIISRSESFPETLTNLDVQPAVMDIKVIPVVSPHILSKVFSSPTVYSTSHPVRGVAMLFFNIQFIDQNFPARTGAEHDLTNLSNLFHQLNYNVKVFVDMTRQEVLRELESQRHNRAHSNYGSFVLGFSTHGSKSSKAIACSDGKSLFLNEIYDHFDSTHCPYLAGKPKFIFFDASLGRAQDRAVHRNKVLEPPKSFEPVKKQLNDIGFSLGNVRMDTLKPVVVPLNNLVPSSTSKVANKSDFIIAMSTFDGYVSWRRNSHGCWFSRIMVEVFEKHACDHHLLELLQMVRRKLSYIETKRGYKQVNMTIDTSLKHLYFFPGVTL